MSDFDKAARSQVVLEAEQRGEQRGRRASLLDLLEARFGPNLPEAVRQAIASQEDLAVLKDWFQTVAVSEETLEAISARLGWKV